MEDLLPKATQSLSLTNTNAEKKIPYTKCNENILCKAIHENFKNRQNYALEVRIMVILDWGSY